VLRGFRWGGTRETYHLQDSGIDGRIILILIFSKVGWGGADRIDLVPDMNRWRTLVNAVMNLRVPQNAGNFLTS